MDDTNLAYLCDDKLREAARSRGDDPDELPRAALAGDGTPLAYVTLFARGLLKHQFCAVFLEDDPGLGDSALLRQVPAERRATLVAKRTDTPDEYRWDLWLQSARETVFFDYE
jgi:protocatechuate 3,4-dioxygenase alpha subunit